MQLVFPIRTSSFFSPVAVYGSKRPFKGALGKNLLQSPRVRCGGQARGSTRGYSLQ